MCLNKPEVLIALILEYLSEQSNFVLFLDVCLNCIDDGSGPLDDQWLQAILLVQISVHVLLERLLSNFVVLTLLVELDLLGIHISDCILQLLQAEDASLSAPNRCVTLTTSWSWGCFGPCALSRARCLSSRSYTSSTFLAQTRPELQIFLLQLLHFVSQDSILATVSNARLRLCKLLT